MRGSKPKQAEQAVKAETKQNSLTNWDKARAVVGLLILTAGFVRGVYLEADKQWVVMGLGVIVAVASVEAVLKLVKR